MHKRILFWALLALLLALPQGCAKPDPIQTAIDFRAAVAQGDLSAVKSAIARDPRQVNQPDSFGATPLDIAVGKGNRQMVELLLSKGANVNHRGVMRGTPLMTAVQARQLEIAKILIEHGADPSLAGPDGRSSIQIARSLGESRMLQILDKAPAAK
jgi:ankyrin repeat protein